MIGSVLDSEILLSGSRSSFTGGRRELGPVRSSQLAPLINLDGLAFGPSNLELAAPGAVASVQRIHSGQGFFGAAKINEEVVVVARLESLRQMR